MTNQELRALVDKSILLNANTRSSILENLETLTEEQKEQIRALLLRSQEKQNGWLKQAFAANPNLLKQVKQHLHEATLGGIRDQEEASKKEEEVTLHELENELNNLLG